MAWKTGIRSKIESYQRLKNWLNTQHYKIQINRKVGQCREKSDNQKANLRAALNYDR